MYFYRSSLASAFLSLACFLKINTVVNVFLRIKFGFCFLLVGLLHLHAIQIKMTHLFFSLVRGFIPFPNFQEPYLI